MLHWTHRIADGGLLYVENGFLAPREADEALSLIRREIPWEQGRNRWGREPRLSAWIADRAELTYHYSGWTRLPLPWPQTLRGLRDRLNNLCSVEFNSCLANLYRDGRDSMGYHADDEPELGPNPVIASLSLGAERTFLLRHRSGGKTLRFVLKHGSLLVMAGTTQTNWKHAIPKTKRRIGERINLTYRRIQETA